MEGGFLRNSKECDIEQLGVEGSIPHWLKGELIRNGPGQVMVDKPMKHWFDGLAMLHRFHIANGNVGYRSRFIDCAAYRSAQKEGRITYSDFATDPCRTLFQQLQTIFNPDPKITDSANSVFPTHLLPATSSVYRHMAPFGNGASALANRSL